MGLSIPNLTIDLIIFVTIATITTKTCYLFMVKTIVCFIIFIVGKYLFLMARMEAQLLR